MTDPVEELVPEATESAAVLTSGLPFAFAKSRNVLLDRSGSVLTLFYVPPMVTEVLLEVRRYGGEVFPLSRSAMRCSESDSPWPISAPRMKRRRWLRISPRTLIYLAWLMSYQTSVT